MAALDSVAVEPRDLLDIAEDVGDALLACRFAYRALGVSCEDEADPDQAAASVLQDLENAHHKLGIAIAEVRALLRQERIALPADTLRWLRQRRREIRMPKKVLARRIGISPGALAKWQVGARRPTLQHYQAWLSALNAHDAP